MEKVGGEELPPPPSHYQPFRHILLVIHGVFLSISLLSLRFTRGLLAHRIGMDPARYYCTVLCNDDASDCKMDCKNAVDNNLGRVCQRMWLLH